jgi:hypothetical protein
MTTYSQLVDAMVLELRRPDLAPEIHSYVNQTIRELHFTADANTALAYRENLREAQLVANIDSGFTWDQPFPDRWQMMAAVRYDNMFDIHGNQRFANPRTPGRGMKPEETSYYQSGNSFVFQNYGNINAVISLAYYEYPRRLKYFPAGATRLASYDYEDGWTYDASVVGAAAQEAAREKCTNWVLFRWEELIREGIRAKVYKRNGDDTRARTSYSAFTAMRRNMESSELAELNGVY